MKGIGRRRLARKLGASSNSRTAPTRAFSLNVKTSIDSPNGNNNVTRAARAAKINKSQHYAKVKSSPEYAAAFQQAFKMGCDALSDVAVTRAH